MLTYFNDIMNTCEESLNSLDVKQFERLIDHGIKCSDNGGTIVARGLGKNGPRCE